MGALYLCVGVGARRLAVVEPVRASRAVRLADDVDALDAEEKDLVDAVEESEEIEETEDSGRLGVNGAGRDCDFTPGVLGTVIEFSQ